MTNAQTILVAGAGGHAGKYIVPLLLERGYCVRLLTRSIDRLAKLFPQTQFPNVEFAEADITNKASLQAACEGVAAVISTVGASLDMNDFGDKRSFHEVDYEGNHNLLIAAKAHGVRKFVYVSAFGGETTDTAYTNAHEAFVQELRQSGLEYSVVRPTGFFYINAEFVAMAQKGFGMVIGDGESRTNPIHEADVAKVCVEALEGSERDIPCGGAEVFTRKEIVQMAFRAVGKKPRLSHIPFRVMRFGSRFAGLFNRRIGEMIAFAAVVATKECVAPTVSTEYRLEEYFRNLAGKELAYKE
ncbi:MAG: SDR family oxidoreductase [Candidatus Kapabacteria bacterium]|jgi:uncharacterized protein YbjT (DUF2867 family)|nr:SDR family oxidoreductase [Candidatus Kapabacteria bacterium]